MEMAVLDPLYTEVGHVKLVTFSTRDVVNNHRVCSIEKQRVEPEQGCHFGDHFCHSRVVEVSSPMSSRVSEAWHPSSYLLLFYKESYKPIGY